MRVIFLAALLLSVNAFGSGKELFERQCAACHGAGGMQYNTPILYGQEAAYILQALKAFKAGTRKDVLMNYMSAAVRSLSESDMEDLAQYVASVDPCELEGSEDPSREGFKMEFTAGREYVNSNNCMHCHATFHHSAPRIVGQKKSFIVASLQSFRNQDRQDPMMNQFAAKMSEEDIKNIATYLSALRLMRSCH